MNEQKRRNKKIRLFSLAMGVLFALPLFSFDANAATQMVQRPTELVPVGKAIGVKLFADGVLVVGLSEGDSAAKDAGIKAGDVLLTFNDKKIKSTEQLRELIAENGEDEASILLQRGTKTQTVPLAPNCSEDGTYRLGAFTRDSMGASDDIQTALEYVRQWVEVFAGNGFSGVVFEHKSVSEDQYLRNETLAAAKMEELYRTARSILHEHYDFLMAVQKALLENETLLGSDIAAIKNSL